MNVNEIDILDLLKSNANVFYEWSCDNGQMLNRAAAEIKELRKFRDDAFKAHPNLDLDIEALK